MNEYERALELKEETIANRRFLHENAETGLHLPETKAGGGSGLTIGNQTFY